MQGCGVFHDRSSYTVRLAHSSDKWLAPFRALLILSAAHRSCGGPGGDYRHRASLDPRLDGSALIFETTQSAQQFKCVAPFYIDCRHPECPKQLFRSASAYQAGEAQQDRSAITLFKF